MNTYDAILVPGGGVREGGELPIWVRRRFDKAIEIFDNEYIIALSAGTTLRPPPLDNSGFPVFESVAGANYLVNNGISPKKILIETCSYDTIGNAFFARVIHVDPRKFKKLLIITSEFHMPRTENIFRWVFALQPTFENYELNFLSVTDEGMDKTALVTRKTAEKVNLAKFKLTKKRIRSFDELHKWIFTEHDAYSVSVSPHKLILNNNLLKTY